MRLIKHARFRREAGYILLCRVDTLQYFEIDQKFLGILELLEKGIELSDFDFGNMEEEVKLFIEDLMEMGVLENESVPNQV